MRACPYWYDLIIDHSNLGSEGAMNLVVIPAYNEEAKIGHILKQVKDFQPSMHILVVDDGSTDNTSEIVREAEVDHYIRFDTNRGYGKALTAGFDFLRESEYRWMITLDGDGQHDPSELSSFVQHFGYADILSGSRLLPESPRLSGAPGRRIYWNNLVTAVINERTNYNLTDAFCGYKAFSREAVDALRPTTDGYIFPLELFLLAKKANLTVREIPVSMIYFEQVRDLKYYIESSYEESVDFLKREFSAKEIERFTRLLSSITEM